MQLVEIDPIPLGVHDLQLAFDKVFREETLRAVHGTDLASVSPWVGRDSVAGGEKRTVLLKVPLGDLFDSADTNVTEGTNALQKLLGRSIPKVIKMTTKQTVNRSNKDASSWEIKNRVSVASIGSDIVCVTPTFYLERHPDDGGQVYLSGRVEHKVLLLPPPFNRKVEEAMAKVTRVNLDKYLVVLRAC